MRSVVWRVGAACAVVAVALTLGGCVPEEPDRTPAPDPTSTPLFASDEEALAAAEEAYGRYQAVEDEIFAAGGVGSERIREVAVRDALEAAQLGFDELLANGYKGLGRTKFDSFELQQYSPDAVIEDSVVAYVCLDFSEADLVDQANNSIVNPNRLVRQPFQVSFDTRLTTKDLILASRDPWAGLEACQ
jgi:hypothetical protein